MSGSELNRSHKNDWSANPFSGTLKNETSHMNLLSGSDNKGDVLNHVMKQINSLKLENLELKKMIGENIKGANNS